MAKPYCIGLDPGKLGAIAVIDQYRNRSVAIRMPPYVNWMEPQFDGDCFYKRAPKGKRKIAPCKGWGGKILDPIDVSNHIRTICKCSQLKGVLSFIEEPGKQGVGRAGLDNSKTVGAGMSALAIAIKRITWNMPIRCSPKEWQSHPAIQVDGRVEWTKGAQDIPEIRHKKGPLKGQVNTSATTNKRKKAAKKHYSITVARELFQKHIQYDLNGSDGIADALLIGLYGAHKLTAVASIPPVLAWFVLNSEKANTIPIAHDALDTTLEMKEYLLYARAFDKDENLKYSQWLVEAYGVTPPRPEEMEQNCIVGFVTTEPKVIPANVEWDLPSQRIVSRIKYPSTVDFDMGGRTLKPYMDQLPHEMR